MTPFYCFSGPRFILGTAVAAALSLMPGVASAALPATPKGAGLTTQVGDVAVRGVAFDNNGITMAGNVDDRREQGRLPCGTAKSCTRRLHHATSSSSLFQAQRTWTFTMVRAPTMQPLS